MSWEAARLPEVLDFLRVSSGLVYNMLSDVSAVDYYPEDYGDDFDGDGTDYRPGRFAVSYHILSMLYNRRLRVKVFATEEDPRLPTATVVWPAVNWLEREIADMMGITFDGHPDQRRLLMPTIGTGTRIVATIPWAKRRSPFPSTEAEIRKHKPFAQN